MNNIKDNEIILNEVVLDNGIILNDSVELSIYDKMINSASDTFTPFKIKDLSPTGKKYMGTYGILALTLLLILVCLNVYGLLKSGEDRIVVLINLLLPFVVSLFTLEKLIAGILHILFKKFQ